MAEKQMIGSEVSIGGGNTEKMDRFESGTISFVGDMLPLSKSSTPFGLFTDQSMGEIQRVGDDVGTLKRTPHRGYESGTPINAQEELPDTKESY
jgi:hypothetical protein